MEVLIADDQELRGIRRVEAHPVGAGQQVAVSDPSLYTKLGRRIYHHAVEAKWNEEKKAYELSPGGEWVYLPVR